MRTFNELVEELVVIEMDPTCHSDNADDYEFLEDFYLSNAEQDDYVSHYLESYLSDDEIKEYDLSEIQDAVVSAIRNKF